MLKKTYLKSVPGILLAMIFVICCSLSPQNKQLRKVKADADGFVQIFDGKTLNNWEGNPTYWRVENGSLVGEVTPATILKQNTFVIWRGGKPANFELKLEYKISLNGNSGINYRSDQLDSVLYALKGYQADIDGMNRYTGQNYEERKRTTLAYCGQKVVINPQKITGQQGNLMLNIKNNAWLSSKVIESLGNSDSLKSHIKDGDWNECHIIAKGNRLQHYLNGFLMSDVTDNDIVNRKASGLIGVQVHVGPPMKVEYRNIRLKVLK